MYGNMIPIEVAKMPDVLKLAEQVYLTQMPQVLRRDSQSIAVVVPFTAMFSKQAEDIWANYDPKRVQKALQKSAGAITRIDKEILLYDISEQRSQETHSRSV